MAKFRKKPVVIEAVQFDGKFESLAVIRKALGGDQTYTFVGQDPSGEVIIPTLEGTMRASPGDWIIRGVKGEFYPCKPDIFAATYERVDNSGPVEPPMDPPAMLTSAPNYPGDPRG